MATKQRERAEALSDEWRNWDTVRISTILWVLAIALFGLGDLLTTTTLIHFGGPEADPVYRFLFMYLPASIALAMAVGAQLVVAYVAYRAIDHPARLLIPLWLALYGATVVVWNWTYIAGM